MSELRVFESFAGIGAVSKSITKLGILHKIVGFSEIKESAIKAFCSIHSISAEYNYGDVCKIDEKQLPDFDLYAFGSPCQDFSVAGKQKGSYWTCNECGAEYNPLDVHYSRRDVCPHCHSSNIAKSRSSLVVEALRIIRYKRPKYLLMENVKNLVGKQFKPSFDRILAELNEYGYETYWAVLSANEYGTPQKRERVFVVSVRKDIEKVHFQFPKGFDSGIRLKDLLDTEVDEKYYLRDDLKTKIQGDIGKVLSDTNRILRYDLIMPVTVRKYAVDILGLQEVLRKGRADSKLNCKQIAERLDVPLTLVAHWFRRDRYFAIPDADVWYQLKELLGITEDKFDASITTFVEQDGVYDKTNRVYDSNGIAPTLTCTGADEKVLIRTKDDYFIRRLTPKEAWLLMGFDAKDYFNAKAAGLSDAQLFECAGNSIDVNCLYYIFKALFQ